MQTKLKKAAFFSVCLFVVCEKSSNKPASTKHIFGNRLVNIVEDFGAKDSGVFPQEGRKDQS